MKTLVLFLSLFVYIGSAQAQENAISINSASSVDIPADRIAFNINLNAEANTPQEAYDMHQKREKVLLDLLKEHQIKEENINFQPISISRVRTHPEGQENRIRTRQDILLTLSDFDVYEIIQIALIDNGFDDFNGTFTSSETDKGKDQALKQALEIARKKAELIARESDLHITSIKSIDFSYNHSPPRPMQLEAAAFRDQANSSLVSEYGQTVSVSANISLKYNFKPLED